LVNLNGNILQFSSELPVLDRYNGIAPAVTGRAKLKISDKIGKLGA